MERTLFEPEHEELRASFRAWLDKEIVPQLPRVGARGHRARTTSSPRRAGTASSA